MKKLEMQAATNEALIQRYEEVVLIHDALRTAREANKAFDEGIAIWTVLKKRGQDAINLFMQLLDSPHPAIRLSAACNVISIVPQRSEAILEELSSYPRRIGLAAQIVLRQWRAGEFKELV